MCFLFGASEEQIRRLLADEAERVRVGPQEPAGTDPPDHARHSSSVCADPPL